MSLRSTSLLLCLCSLLPRTAGAEQSIVVEMGDYRFSPDEIHVQAGETVQLELTNTDLLTPHNFSLQREEAGLDLDVDVDPGETKLVDVKPLKPGSYTFYCNKKLLFFKSHREHGMEGTLVVEPAGP
ncbi:MAG: cupredoxin domain-containing protein [Gammaproteobacteria bacterium]